jgi:prepilin-type N-terminal cleavage/methylation domain-containing protein
MRRQGFTLLEVLVASVLMGMLVTILTMIFNQSAIAWRTGKAGIADITQAEREMARIHYLADNVLPVAGRRYCVVSPWKISEEGKGSTPALNDRGVAEAGTLKLGLPSVNPVNLSDRYRGLKSATDIAGGKSYVVGVRSAGPNRRFGDEDDISSWPEKE